MLYLNYAALCPPRAEAEAEVERTLAEFNARNNGALNTLINTHKVTVKKFPDSVLDGLGALSGDVLRDLSEQNTLSQEVMNSILDFRAQSISYGKFSEQAFYNARSLPFKYVR